MVTLRRHYPTVLRGGSRVALDLSGRDLGDADAQVLADMLRTSSLEELRLTLSFEGEGRHRGLRSTVRWRRRHEGAAAAR